MKFTIDHKQFRDIVEALKLLTSKNLTRPMLCHIHLYSKDNELVAEALDGYVLLQVHTTATIDEPGEMLLPNTLKLPAAGKSTFPVVVVEGSMSQYKIFIPALGSTMIGRNGSIQDTDKYTDVKWLLEPKERNCSRVLLDPALLESMSKAFVLLGIKGEHHPMLVQFHGQKLTVSVSGHSETVRAEGIMCPVRVTKDSEYWEILTAGEVEIQKEDAS